MTQNDWYLEYKKISVFILLIMFLTATIFSGVVAELSEQMTNSDNTITETDILDYATKDIELESNLDSLITNEDFKGQENVIYGDDWREVQNPDGTNTLSLGIPTFYRDGKYHPVDTTIKRLEMDEYDFGVEDGKYQAYFKENVAEPMPVMINYGEHELAMELNEMGYFDYYLYNYQTFDLEPSIGTNNLQTVFYPEVFSNIDLEYEYGTKRLKENIIINDISSYNFASGASTDTLDFIFDLSSSRNLALWADGTRINHGDSISMATQLELRTRTGDVIFTLPQPMIYEQNNPMVQILGHYDAEHSNGKLTISIKTPMNWLLDADREYPIVVDPVVVLSKTLYTTQNLGVYSVGQSPFSIYMGWYSNTYMYGFHQFNMSRIKQFCMIFEAKIYTYCGGVTGGGGKSITPFRILEDWDESIPDSSNVPVRGEGHAPGQTVSSTSTWYNWNVTSLVQGWASGYYANHGLVLTASSTGTVDEWSWCDSDSGTNPPYLDIRYYNSTMQISPPIPTVTLDEDSTTYFSLADHEHRTSEKYNSGDFSVNDLPFHGSFYSEIRQQFIYYPNDIGMGGIIDKISFYKEVTDTGSFSNFSIRLAHTILSQLSTTFENNYQGELVEVFNRSTFTINQATNTMISIDIDNIFNYNPKFNLIVDVRWQGTSGASIGTQTSSYISARLYAGNYYALTGIADSIRNDLKFEVISTNEIAYDYAIAAVMLPFASSATPAVRYQMIYRQDFIGKAGIIDKIYLRKSDSNFGNYENFTIYMCNTENITTGTNYVNNYGSGSRVKVLPKTTRLISGPAYTWVEFDVNDVFYYNNHDSLLIELRWNYTNASNNVNFNVSAAGYICGLFNLVNDTQKTGNLYVGIHEIKIKFKETDLMWDISNIDNTLITIDPADIKAGDDRFKVTGQPDQNGLDQVKVTLSNSNSIWNTTQWVDIDVLPVNDPPMNPINLTPGDDPQKQWYAGPIPIHWEHQDIDSTQQNVSIQYRLGTSGPWIKVVNSSDTISPYVDGDFVWLKPVEGNIMYLRVSTSDGEYWSPWTESQHPIAFDNTTPIIEFVEVIDLATNNYEYVKNGDDVQISAKISPKYFLGALPPGYHIFVNLTGLSLGENEPLTLSPNKNYANITIPGVGVITQPINGLIPIPVSIPTLFGDPIIMEGFTIADNLGVKFTEPSVPPGGWINKVDNVRFTVNISDNGSGVNTNSLSYKVSTNGGETWTNPLPVTDKIDNNFESSPEYVVRIDTRGATYSDIMPDNLVWYNTTNILCSINISDNLSGVNPGSIKYKYSTTGLAGYGPWFPVANANKTIFGKSVKCKVLLEFEEGPNNWLTWYAEDLAGNIIETDQLNYLVDLTPPLYRDSLPPQDGWANSYNYECKIVFEDTLSGVDNTTIEYRTSKNGTDGYSAWQPGGFTELSPLEVYASGTGEFTDGFENYVQWRVIDRAGNEVTTPDFRFRIDLTEVRFVAAKPEFGNDPATWSDTKDVACSVIVTDGDIGSGVDATTIMYRYSTNGSENSKFGPWTPLGLSSDQNSLIINVSITITFEYGDQNFIQWRAMDVSGNGFTNSSKYQIKIKPLDTDSDGMPDLWEETYNLDPNNAGDANQDKDNDGLTNLEEYELILTYGTPTDPTNSDTDGDGVMDGQEIEDGTNPLDDQEFVVPGKKKKDTEGDDNFMWLILAIIIVIVVVLIILFLVFRRKGEEEEPEERRKPEPWDEDMEEELEGEEEEEEYPEDEDYEEEEELGEWKIEDEAEPVSEPEREAARAAAEEDEFIDIDLAAPSKPVKGKMPKGKKKPGIVRHKKGKPKKGKMPKPEPEEDEDFEPPKRKKEKVEAPVKGKAPKKGKLPKKKEVEKPKKKKLEAEPEIEEEEFIADEEMEEELAAAEAEEGPAVPLLVRLDESATCNICLGTIKTGLPVIKCTCGKKYHDSCADRVGTCPNCDTDLSNPESRLEDDDEEMTEDDLDALDSEE
jgi:hypothetical protein